MNILIKLLSKQNLSVTLFMITVVLGACENNGSAENATMVEATPADAGIAVVADEFVLSVFQIDANDEPQQVDDVELDQDSLDRDYIIYP